MGGVGRSPAAMSLELREVVAVGQQGAAALAGEAIVGRLVEHALDIADGEDRTGLGRERFARPIVHALDEPVEQTDRVFDDGLVVGVDAVQQPAGEFELSVEQCPLRQVRVGAAVARADVRAERGLGRLTA